VAAPALSELVCIGRGSSSSGRFGLTEVAEVAEASLKDSGGGLLLGHQKSDPKTFLICPLTILSIKKIGAIKKVKEVREC